jgi:serine/threonine-protein kinase
VPAGLDAVVMKALAREPEARFRWANELRDALVPYAAPEGGPALARTLARLFPSDLRAELARLDGLRQAMQPEARAVEPAAQARRGAGGAGATRERAGEGQNPGQ